jgi:hypothetical protein
MTQKDSEKWGIRLNNSISSYGSHGPEWLSRYQVEKRKRKGLVIWNEDEHQVVNISGGGALGILDNINGDDGWKENGLIIGEPALEFNMPPVSP